MQLLFSPNSDDSSASQGHPQSRATEALRMSANMEAASERRILRLIERYGVDLREWFIAPRGAWEVTEIGEVEVKAGAEIGDLAVLCDVPDSRIDLDSSAKSRDNFRGVYTTRTEPKLRCYYFAPLQQN